MKIYSREEWGAQFRDGFGTRSVGNLRIYQHHSVSSTRGAYATLAQDFADMRALESIGQNRFGGGISYTFAIFPSGRVMEGHSINRIGAHTGGYNTISAAIVYVGNYENMKPTEKQLKANAELLAHGVTKGWWKTPKFTGAHRMVKATACSGRYAIAKIPYVNDLAAKSLKSPVKQTVAKVTTKKPTSAVLKKGSKSAAVGRLQKGLNKSFPSYKNVSKINKGRLLFVDNEFGAHTEEFVKIFQRRTGLVPDGVVGDKTRAKLKKFGITY